MKYLAIAIVLIILTAGLVMTSVSADEYSMTGTRDMQGMQNYGAGKTSLTQDQVKIINKLKLEHKKKIYLLKTKLQQAKFDLTILMMNDSPNQNNINKKIDEIIKIKSEKMRLKVWHKIEVRKVLNDEQRVYFDMTLLTKSSFDKRRMHQNYH